MEFVKKKSFPAFEKQFFFLSVFENHCVLYPYLSYTCTAPVYVEKKEEGGQAYFFLEKGRRTVVHSRWVQLVQEEGGEEIGETRRFPVIRPLPRSREKRQISFFFSPPSINARKEILLA